MDEFVTLESGSASILYQKLFYKKKKKKEYISFLENCNVTINW